jgi:hypothetical protein
MLGRPGWGISFLRDQGIGGRDSKSWKDAAAYIWASVRRVREEHIRHKPSSS